jgi:lipopolysaccharide export system ATP-binding protein
MEKSCLKAENIGKSYASRKVVRNVSIEVSQGEIVGLLGPNGAGKTTIFYMLIGLVEPDYGAISINEDDVTHLPIYRRAKLGLGYLPQEPSIFRGLNVEDNIRAILEVNLPDKEAQDSKLEELLGDFSITHLRKAPSLSLSGGERRRLEIARALAANPKFILLDEPLAGIDPIAINDIRELIIKLKSRGIGVIITDHNVREALSVIDRGYIIYDGLVLMQGSSQEIVANEQVKKVYLGEQFSY